MRGKVLVRLPTVLGCIFVTQFALVSCTTAPLAPESAQTLEAWQASLSQAKRRRDQTQYVTALTAIARSWPDRFRAMNADSVLIGFGGTRRDFPGWRVTADADRMRDLCEVTYAANFTIYGGIEPLVQTKCIRLFADVGDWQRARPIARKISTPHMALRLKVDKRYDPLVQAEPDSFEILPLVEKQISDWKGVVQRFPRDMSLRVKLIIVYLDVGKYRDALALADELILSLERAGSAKGLYDNPTGTSWLYEYRASAAQGLGDLIAAERDMLKAARLPENGHANVSNVLNLAAFYEGNGKPRDALAVLDEFRNSGQVSSAYGRMIEYGIRHRVAVSTGDAVAAKEAINYLRANGRISKELLVLELVRTGRLDEAAAVYVDWLNDPGTRSVALMWVQDYLDVEQPLAETLCARADVRAAIEKVGRIERVPMLRGDAY
jgi:hypothetical protein